MADGWTLDDAEDRAEAELAGHALFVSARLLEDDTATWARHGG